MIKIFIADDHAIVREGLKQIVAEERDMQVCGEADNSVKLLQELKKSDCNILILDINMPKQSGLEVLKQIRMEYPTLPILILSIYSEEQYGIRAIKAGASGYLVKASAPNELITAIRKIVSGRRYISSSLAEKLAEYLGTTKTSLHETLSDREFEVMKNIARGLSPSEISNSLNISIHTYYSYRNRVLEKMKLKSNVEIAQYAIENKLLD